MIVFVAAPETTLTTEMASGNATYYVTAVYEQGESLPSNEVNVTASGIDEIMATMPADALQGRQLTELQPGVNIIRYSNGKARKVFVK